VALLPPTQVFDLEGTIATSTARYRSSGAHDGSQANAYSWEMTSDADASDFIAPLISPPITRWVQAGSQVLKIYVASGVTLQNDELWIEVLSPSTAGIAAANYQSSRADPLATPADLTTDSSSTWTGAGVGTKQYATVTIVPTIPGPVVVRVHLAKPSTTVYVDPVIEVNGDVAGWSRYVDGVQMLNVPSAQVIGG
jgi:hypothetical protein